MKSVGAFEAKTHLSRLLNDVEHQHVEIFIKKHGVPVAVLLSYATYQQTRLEVRKKEVLEGFRNVRKTVKGSIAGDEIRAWIDEGRNA